MSIKELKAGERFLMYIGLPFLGIGMSLYFGNSEGTFLEKIGVVLFTCGTMFVGISFACMIALKQPKIR